jgi:cytochrome c biogenesis protein CcdA
MKLPLILLILATASFALDIDFYYGEGCTHCAATSEIFDELSTEYDLNITTYEVYSNAENREAMFRLYDQYGIDVRTGGVPTTIIDNKVFIVGEMEKSEWEEIIDECIANCTKKALNRESSEFLEEGSTAQLTLPVLVGAAIVDSINPCTIAVMVLLIGAVLYSKGKKQALVSGLLFAFTIFVMYILYGFGIMHAITTLELTRVFYMIVTAAAFILAIMEVRAFVDYKPGMMAVEMPMFLRPHAKKVTSEATSPLGVIVAAIFCSLFLIPCSSGPYLIVLGMIAKAATLQTVSYLLLYNFIFVLPMLIITVLIFFGKTTVEKVGKAKDKYIRYIHLVSGIILFLLFFLMMMELSRVF